MQTVGYPIVAHAHLGMIGEVQLERVQASTHSAHGELEPTVDVRVGACTFLLGWDMEQLELLDSLLCLADAVLGELAFDHCTVGVLDLELAHLGCGNWRSCLLSLRVCTRLWV